MTEIEFNHDIFRDAWDCSTHSFWKEWEEIGDDYLEIGKWGATRELILKRISDGQHFRLKFDESPWGEWVDFEECELESVEIEWKTVAVVKRVAK